VGGKEDNIKMNLGMDWIYLAQDVDQWWDVVNTVRNEPLSCTPRQGISSQLRGR
jgi:hypothetical protein